MKELVGDECFKKLDDKEYILFILGHHGVNPVKKYFH